MADKARTIVQRANALGDDLVREYAQLRRCRPADLSANAITAIRGAVLEGADATLYAARELAKDGGQDLSGEELLLLQRAVRQGAALGAEVQREAQAAERRIMGERTTSPAAPRGAFGRSNAERAADQQPRRPAAETHAKPAVDRNARTAPIDPHDRVTAPGVTPVTRRRGDPRQR